MKTQLLHRPEIQQLSGPLALALDELVSGNNVQPLEVGDAKIRSGIGSPEGRLAGNPADLFLRTDGTAGLVVYRKATGKNTTTGWVPNGAARGTWTPADGSGAGLAFTIFLPAVYVAIPLTTGTLVTVTIPVLYPATASGAGAVISGLPFPCGPAAGAGALGFTTAGLAFTIDVTENTSKIQLYTLAGAAVTNVQLTGKYVKAIATYIAA